MPTTRMAGKTSNVSLQLTMARTSQNGTMTAVIGRMRPIVAFMSGSGRPRNRGQRVDWSPDAAPGHRRGVGDQVQRRRMERLESQPDHESAGDGHGRTEAGAPSMNAPKQNATSST